jgi:alkanesulfonate monooxygenase SsuD/methylene tetrahydromethanopterin reductase-like flavin-dependent oxidoreductase (luciferase family)
MKFSLFAHVERFDGTTPWPQLYGELQELVQVAEDGGFAAFWTGEHYGMEFTVGPDPLTLLVHLASQTRSIRLVTGNIVAPFWHPLRLASEAALADVLTNGRIELGIARGAYQFEFDRVMDGMNAMQGGSHLREIVPLLHQLWRGDVAHEGENWSFPTATSVPKPVQEGGPPIWIAARDPSSHDFAVANGCDVCCTPLAKDDTEVEDLVAKFQTACAAHPEVPRPRLMMLRHAFVVERDDQVPDAARAVKDWYAYFEKWIRNDGSVRLGHTGMLDDAELAAKPIYDLDAVTANNLIGTPETLIPRLQRYRELGIDEVGLWLDNGRPHAEKRAALELFIREVVPAFA